MLRLRCNCRGNGRDDRLAQARRLVEVIVHLPGETGREPVEARRGDVCREEDGEM